MTEKICNMKIHFESIFLKMASENISVATDDLQESKSISTILELCSILQNFIYYLPSIFLILGFIRFVGNLITYLQPELRSNTCCIYSLRGSIVDIIHLFINALPDYLTTKHGIKIPWETSSHSCRILYFLYTCLPNLSINFLVMSTIDHFACSCSLTSKFHRLNQLKKLPWTISLTIIISSYCYYFNNVKSFYLSLLTSKLFRKNFIKIFINLLLRYVRL
jgi:hypothetical protein